MTDRIESPEWLIGDRVLKTLRQMAAENVFVASEGEAVFPIRPQSVLPWITMEGSDHNRQAGMVNLPMSAILVTTMPVDGGGRGVNTAEDEVIVVVIQLTGPATGSRVSQRPIRTYSDWMNQIRRKMLGDPLLFRQDFDPSVADPYLVMSKRRIPADPQSLWHHEQRIAAFSFYVKVRHYRVY
jgi:hypothetical protein